MATPILVEAVTGHWGMPGQVPQGATAASYPYAPPSTIQGFLESLVGAPRGAFKGRFAYGLLREPGGHGFMDRRVHVWASQEGTKRKETIRLNHIEVWYDVAY